MFSIDSSSCARKQGRGKRERDTQAKRSERHGKTGEGGEKARQAGAVDAGAAIEGKEHLGGKEREVARDRSGRRQRETTRRRRSVRVCVPVLVRECE